MNGEIGQQQARIGEATGRLVTTAAALTDAQTREPSLLPGWTRGHVLTHIARNADGLANLLGWARTGRETPMYASADSRRADLAPRRHRAGRRPPRVRARRRCGTDRRGLRRRGGQPAAGRLDRAGPGAPGAAVPGPGGAGAPALGGGDPPRGPRRGLPAR